VTVHHLNCATMRPVGAFGGRLGAARMVAHCLLVERPEGLLLVDSGFGTGDIANPERLGRPFRAIVRPALDAHETARAHVLARGHRVEDVTDIVLTHLDLDHAGGIGDFPQARVHVLGDELDAALAPRLRERARYIGAQWGHGPRWERHAVAGDTWFGFEAVTALGDDVLLVPLRGHTRGHCGVAVRRPDGHWLLHAGDSYFHRGDLQSPVSTPPALRGFQRLMAVDDPERRHNLERLRELHAGQPDEVTVFSAHDPDELSALGG
jgi:glyoxylase-like metal-dependent hydrolase (beta-lactamase superfamily II)